MDVKNGTTFIIMYPLSLSNGKYRLKSNINNNDKENKNTIICCEYVVVIKIKASYLLKI
jgi:hypothetical protein